MKKQKLLSEFAVGELGTVVNVAGEGAIRRRLFDMGVTPGTDILLRKKAPLGDPLEITLRGYELTPRKTEAANVTMEGK
jgi:Fe2+ transport system protein FeoA